MDNLLREIDDEGIDIVEMDFKGVKKGLYGDSVIAIDKRIKDSRTINCVLAEELGHHYTSYGNILNYNDIKNAKQEKRARNWAYEKLVGVVQLINAHNAGTRNKYELAEYLNVTEEFLEAALNHYKEKYGLFLEIDTYLVQFDPLAIIKMF